MEEVFYLPRTLLADNKEYSEADLLTASRYIVVLGEPGGGKTELMNSLANQLGSVAVTANVFGQVGATAEETPLVIDAFDELAKVDKTGIHRLLGNAKKTNPTHVIISSRSSEWDNAATSSFKDFLYQAPLIVRFREFNEAEQQKIFEHHVPNEDFVAFQKEVARFDLDVLLPNPQFLKLFADAFVESGRRFTDKRSIFEQAVERLAKEANTTIASIEPTLPAARKVQLASEVFAKLLLSGAEGVGTSEASENRMYPLLAALFVSENVAEGILATRLFKPGDNTNQHRPVHKIVSEYCAANYLTKRIADPSDSLTLFKCLPIIAPNSTVRDELRGMLGWMASLGNKPIQEAAIDLDSYAVLANGDPSQLEPSSKRLLVSKLKDIADQDPYFRREDLWRRFSVAGFFTQEVVDEIKPLLTQEGDGHLRDLILELLVGSSAIAKLTAELRHLVLTPDTNENTRVLASRCLLETEGYDHYADLAVLIFEASHISLKLAAGIIETLGSEAFGKTCLAGFFRVCANLYPGHEERQSRTSGMRYFVKRFIACLDLKTIIWLLDALTKDLACKCGEESWECDCRNGMSKIIGSMLDIYFDLASPPYDPKRVWQWIGNLNFHESTYPDRIKSVQVLQKDDTLRHGIVAHVFGKLADRDQILEVQIHFNMGNVHSGLLFQPSDCKFVVDLAFETDNADLWASNMAGHQLHGDKASRGPNSLRRHMREQALKKPAFMSEFAKSNRAIAKLRRECPMPYSRTARRMKRRRTQEDKNRVADIKYIQDNRKLVEGGRDWRYLVRFAKLVLTKPAEIKCRFGDETLVRNAIRNCLDFIDEHVPDLQKLAELHCTSQYLCVEMILYAACLEIMRAKGNLAGVDLRLLTALRTNINRGYSAVSTEEQEALKAEVDRLIFPDTASSEKFLRQYVEPQLAIQGCCKPEICLLRDEEILSPFLAGMSIEWLKRFRGLDIDPLGTLFEIAAQFDNHKELKEIIDLRCAEFMFFWPNPTDSETIENKRTFWLVRAWYFLDEAPKAYWEWLKADKNTVLLLYELSGGMNRSRHPSWPKFTSDKIEAILDAFFEKWPKVNLPSSWGTSSPKGETAYRFLTNLIRVIGSDDSDAAFPVLNRMLADQRYVDMHNELKSIRASQHRKKALRNFEPPSPQEIANLLDHDAVVTVGGLRQLLIQELRDFQAAIDGGEFNTATVFYENGQRICENKCTERIAERLNLRLQPQNISITVEHQLKAAKRSDFTVAKVISGTRRLLVAEVKGQWHKELYTAVAAQLHERYSIHPDAEQQGVYLVLWFGQDEKVANRKNHGIANAQELKDKIEAQMPPELLSFINVFILDVSGN